MAGDVRRHAGWVTEKSLAARHSRTPCGDGRGQRGASPGSRLGKPAGSGGTEATRRPPSPADHEPEFEEGTSLERHKGLRKHESSVLIQMRTRKIGLRAFLHQRRVPEVLTPGCSCGDAPETPEHLLLSCRETVGGAPRTPGTTDAPRLRGANRRPGDRRVASTMDATVGSAAPVRPSRAAAKRGGGSR